ncbi:MFS transporter [Stappia sp.]|uniref:MFS transporter n=1 Tax=Stappia sp. TaxID=1870903 RepID=UPI003A9A0C27
MSLARTRGDADLWSPILLVVAAGVASAIQVGKAPAVLSAIQADLGLSLAAVAWLMSAFAVTGALAGLPVGFLADRIGAKRMVVAGLLLQAAGSLLGALAGGTSALVATRFLEGAGFLAVIVAAPALVAAIAPERLRDRAMALWATFMPAGLTLALLSGALAGVLGWRGLWGANAALLLLAAACLGAGLRLAAMPERRERAPTPSVGVALRASGPWVLAGLFCAFTAAFFCAFTFLPAYLSGRFGMGAGEAGVASALAVAASGVGNLACGKLLSGGMGTRRLLVLGFGVMAASGAVMFAPFISAPFALSLSMIFAFAGGLVPVVIFDAAPRLAPQGQVGATLGLAMQGSNVGLLVGPAIGGMVAETWGWPVLALPLLGIALAALGIVALARRI